MRVLKMLVPVLFLFSVFAINVSAQEKSKYNDQVFSIVEQMPEYPGGSEALGEDIAKAVQYPEEAKKKGVEGKVYISFVVTEEGKIVKTKIARGVEPSLDKEALRVVNSLDKTWSPGKEKGKLVKVRYTVPINFALGLGKSSDAARAPKKDDDVFFIVEEMPEFPGGDSALREYIAKSVQYPEEAKKKGIEGKVYVSFVVNVDGTVTAEFIERGVDPLLDKESLRVVRGLPKWKPGKEKGKAVKVKYTVPINFALS